MPDFKHSLDDDKFVRGHKPKSGSIEQKQKTTVNTMSLGRGRRVVVPLEVFEKNDQLPNMTTKKNNFLRIFIKPTAESIPKTVNFDFPNFWKDHPGQMTKFSRRWCKYANNKIRTTKYTIISFLPKNLFEQMHRWANLYFIFIALLNWMPVVNAFAKEVNLKWSSESIARCKKTSLLNITFYKNFVEFQL